MSTFEAGKGGDGTVIKGRFVYLLLVASVFAYSLAFFAKAAGISDGGGLL